MTKNAKLIILALLFIVTIILFVVFKKSKSTVTSPDYNKVITITDTVDKKIDSIIIKRDTILKRIETSNTKIKYIDRWYEKERDVILTQPTDSDIMFFTNYLSENSK